LSAQKKKLRSPPPALSEPPVKRVSTTRHGAIGVKTRSLVGKPSLGVVAIDPPRAMRAPRVRISYPRGRDRLRKRGVKFVDTPTHVEEVFRRGRSAVQGDQSTIDDRHVPTPRDTSAVSPLLHDPGDRFDVAAERRTSSLLRSKGRPGHEY
jgi:hypothetical protein